MVYMKLLRSTEAHARIVRIDTTRALAHSPIHPLARPHVLAGIADVLPLHRRHAEANAVALPLGVLLAHHGVGARRKRCAGQDPRGAARGQASTSNSTGPACQAAASTAVPKSRRARGGTRTGAVS